MHLTCAHCCLCHFRYMTSYVVIVTPQPQFVNAVTPASTIDVIDCSMRSIKAVRISTLSAATKHVNKGHSHVICRWTNDVSLAWLALLNCVKILTTMGRNICFSRNSSKLARPPPCTLVAMCLSMAMYFSNTCLQISTMRGSATFCRAALWLLPLLPSSSSVVSCK